MVDISVKNNFEPTVTPAVTYRIEGGGIHQQLDKNQEIIDDPFDLSDNDLIYFTQYFYQKEHENFLFGGPSCTVPVCVSLALHDDEYVALVRTKSGNERIKFPKTAIKTSFFRKLFGMGPTPAEKIKAVDAQLPFKSIKKCTDSRLADALHNLEEKQTIKGFKFGILYAQEGQTKEDEMFANVETSPEFEEFLDFLGERVNLNGWPHFRAGLDVKNGTTGEVGLFIRWNNNEIMYHVSTLLPFNPLDKQQLERKRHIGNDIVVIIFQDGDTEYRPTTISSRQIHVVFLVKAVLIEGKTHYRLAVISKDGVPQFGPEIPPTACYPPTPEFKELFYRKLLNAEKACYKAPMLESKLTRTRTALLNDLAERYL